MDDRDARRLSELGVRVDAGLATFEIAEDDSRWPDIKAWVHGRKPGDIVRAEFSDDEFMLAECFALESEWHWSYPQPNSDDFGYLNTTYAGSSECKRCGSGLIQRDPFRMKSEPKWGAKSVLQLNWVFDEYFVRRDVWDRVFEPFGMRAGKVLGPKGIPLTTVVQLLVGATVELDTDCLTGDTCIQCGVTKYPPPQATALKLAQGESVRDVAKTAQYFGSGHRAFHEILVSQRLGRVLLREKLKGIALRPLVPSGSAEK